MFDEANVATERRSNRVNRRRRAREKARINMLKELLEDEINKVDTGFFHRLEESKYLLDDRTEDNVEQKYALFAKGTTGEKEYTDVDYYRDYPTIFHLRSELAHSDEPHDVRLLYLALLNMFKHRGHFLNETLGTDGAVCIEDGWKEFNTCFDLLLNNKCEEENDYRNVFSSVNFEDFKQTILKKGVSKSQIREDSAKVLGITKKNKCEYAILSLMCGLVGNLEDIFGKEAFESEENKGKKTLNFRNSSYDEDIANIQDVLDEEAISLVLAVKEVHDVLLLDQIMQGQNFLCDARVDMYNQHKEDLKLLKKTIKRFVPEEYNNLFRKMKDGNYSSYVGSTNCDKEDGKIRRYVADHAVAKRNYEPDELYKTIKKILTPFVEDNDVADIISKIDSETFLRKQLTSSNGVIPNQVYVREMKAILNNAEKYLPSLLQKDSNGLTVSERILALFQFRVPYYVGPLGGLKNNNGNKWAVRISGDPITPWNINQVIDEGATRQAFIENLIRHCTYLQDERVLPKHSLLYEKFMVLNELNNVKISGKPISIELKQDIYNSLFMKGKPVTRKKLCEFLAVRGVLNKGEENLVSGIEDRFHNSLTSIGKFNGIFDAPYMDRAHVEMIENIILLGTIYGDSKKQFRKEIQKKYGANSETPITLTDAQIQRISGFKFSDWGRCSKAFFELEGASKEDGIIRTIINALWETNDNLMQLLSKDKYTYFEEINTNVTSSEKAISEWTIDDLDNMYLSAPVKRMVWQTLRVLTEIEEVMGRPPKRVFVEMTRENREKGNRTKSRKSQLLELYKNSELKKEQRDWISELESHSEQEFRIKKLYLYYCQMGRCMYTNEPIDLDQLMDDNLYDIDHIYPRHFVKDDSIENNLVLVKKTKNAHKSDVFPIESSIQNQCYSLWNDLRKKNLISKEKYDRLTRKTEFTLDERVGFVQRQLVETGQGTKAITQILNEILPESSDIVFSKAGIVTQFRHDFDIWKSRSVNDFHHAQDAYLNIVAGNVYFTKFTKNPRYFIKEALLHSQDEKYQYHLSKMYEHTVQRGAEVAWVNEKGGRNNTIDVVKKQVFKTTPIVSRRSYVATGAITSKDTNWGKQKTKDAAVGAYFPLKTSDKRLSDVTKYGGKSGISTAAYSLISYKEGEKQVRSIESIPVFLMRNGRLDENGQNNLLDYYIEMITKSSKKTCRDFKIIYPVIKFNSLLKIDGYYYFIGGKTANSYYLYNAVPLKLSDDEIKYVKKIEKAIQNDSYEEKDENNTLIITSMRNQLLFEELVQKMNSGIFLNRKGGLRVAVDNGKNKFETLEVPEQCVVLKNIIASFASNTQNVDLSLLNEGAHVGTIYLSKYIEKLMECKLINQSATGLFENEVDLLHL